MRLSNLFNSHDMIFGFYLTIFYLFLNEYLYLDPWYQINHASLDYCRYFSTILQLIEVSTLNTRVELV